MNDYRLYKELSPTFFAEILPVDQVMDSGIGPLWQPMTRIAGPAYTVRCAPGSNLMLHAAIYRAEPGSVLVIQAGDTAFAVSGGNVCAIAQQRGIAGFIVDGLVRDLQEVRENRFPIFARGISPKPGNEKTLGTLREPVECGGVEVNEGDIIVADEEGIVVVPRQKQSEVLKEAGERADKDAAITLSEWAADHRARTDQILLDKGFTD